METLSGPVICAPAAIRGQQQWSMSVPVPPISASVVKSGPLRSGIWVANGGCRNVAGVGFALPRSKAKKRGVCCGFSSSSDGNGSWVGRIGENDEDYVNSTVIEAVEIRSSSDGFLIKMRDGRHMRCTHNSPLGGQLPDYAPHPAIVLKMDDGSDILLPFIVLEMPIVMLMAAICNVQISRPTIYQVVKEMIEKMGYMVQLVRVTKRVHEAYFAHMYLAKVGDAKDTICLDLRPSDAINMAVRCKVPIQVNRKLAYSDGMKIVEQSKQVTQPSPSDGLLFTDLDRPDGHSCLETTEFGLVRNMLIAAVEERYRDAAQWRDKLTQLRSKKRKNWA